MAEYNPQNACGVTPFTAKAGGTIAAGKTVMASGDGTVTQGTAAGKATVIGIAAQDAVSGQSFTVWPIHGPIHKVTCPAGATVGHAAVAGDAGVIVDVAAVGTDAALGSLLGIMMKTVAADSAALATFAGRG